jgi:mannose-1-phosphate guanylyltransferase
MLSVAGIPFTQHQIIKARDAGIKEIVLATSYLAEIFQPYFGDGSRFGINVRYAVEEVALGTGGAIGNAAKMLQEEGPVVIFNGDVLSSHDLKGQINFHAENEADISLYLTEVADARAYGAVEMSGVAITSFNEKMEKPPTNIINAGCYIFNREMISTIPEGEVISVERQTFPGALAVGKKLYGFVDRSYWLDIGTPAALLKATSDLISGEASSVAFDELLASGAYEKKGTALIGSTAKIASSAVVGDGSFIGQGVSLGEGSKISQSVIGDGASIGDRADIESSFVAQSAVFPAGSIAKGQFFGF